MPAQIPTPTRLPGNGVLFFLLTTIVLCLPGASRALAEFEQLGGWGDGLALSYCVTPATEVTAGCCPKL